MWTLEGHRILCPKGRKKKIMILDFFHPWLQLNLLSLPQEKQEELVSLELPLEVVPYFEYGIEN